MSGDVPEGEGLAAAAVVLTQVALPEGLAAACAMSKVPVDAVPTSIGAVAVCRDTAVGEPERAAQVVSRLLENTPVVLVVQRDGQMTAARWAGGAQDEEIAPGLMLDGAPAEVEQLLLGQVQAADLPGTVSSVGMSRWRAVRVLAAVGRAGRRSR
ncbi:hypothetical protein [Cellulomonas bogoriensis]|uniref:Uncharacterized protein n=1 Tax=Cellulomonas bogoriensis 69B4 = DSM 16987 TaxID=1386082 RepID=A0A0A0C0A9_9CELL|nr:hypothetical protein [Cellulomonas bogoriensis]KGM13372.1 hypothetical protein N869_14550 [Cellulomonas bogoriensis 69B4 = DSM 16987]